MTKIDIDTTKLRYAATDLNTSTNEYKETIRELYEDKIAKMPETKAWYGDAADKYIKASMLEKAKIDNHANNLSAVSKALTNYVDALESGIKSNILK